MDELVEVRRSRRARRWTLSVPWGSPPTLTVPQWMQESDVERIIAVHRDWIARERASQRPKLRLDPAFVSESEARRAARELVTMLCEDEAAELGVRWSRIDIRDQRSRWGSCSTRGTLSFNWRLVLAPFEVLDYVVVHELCHLREPNHSRKFWRLVESRRPDWRLHRDWLHEHGPELLAFRPAA
ncbi:MAG TPA: M48 family metallopeptidase [Gaiellaceae bacterium]